jgi:hypothetical protein
MHWRALGGTSVFCKVGGGEGGNPHRLATNNSAKSTAGGRRPSFTNEGRLRILYQEVHSARPTRLYVCLLAPRRRGLVCCVCQLETWGCQPPPAVCSVKGKWRGAFNLRVDT